MLDREPARHTSVSGRIKGAALLELVRWYEAEHGHDRLAHAICGLADPIRRELGLDAPGPTAQILSSRWYDAVAIHALLDALVADGGAGARDRMAREGAEAVMRATLRGVYRILFDWLASPARYARFADRLWRAYYDTGRFQVEHPDATCAIARILDWPSHHPLLCDMHTYAAAEIYQAMGCTGVEVHRQSCVASGATECRFVTSWK